ncbi:sensor histidine kinase [Methanobacterium alcaliphilum]|uniref:sensor histidine kinase n=1 Tax=Methanobacterium alcaliphilum TaxID=392018 RepID=UPI00200AF0BB|nr:PAS domain S-box protein [Methanobacterium alcaliphilum]MCK9151861.1 PAS domain S-box protein [Methanobacterium alcaliphilum]
MAGNMDAALNKKSFNQTALILFIVIIIFSIIPILFFDNGINSIYVTDATAVIFNIIAAAALSYTANWASKHNRKNYSAWLFLAIAQSSYAFGDIVYLFLDLVLKVSPYPSLADLFFIAYYPIFAIGILMLFRPLKINLKTLIDILIVMTSSTLILWFLVIHPTLDLNGGVVISSIFSVSYIFLDILMLLVILILLLNLTKKPLIAPLLFFSGAIFSQIFADIIYAYYDLSSIALFDWISSILYLLGYFFVTLAAISCYKRIEMNLEPFLSKYKSLKKRKTWLSYLPLILVVIVYSLIIYIEDPYDELLWGVGAIVVLVLIRQFISLNEIKKAQKTLKKNRDIILKREEQLRFINSNMMDLITESNETGHLKFVSESSFWLFGYSSEFMLGKKLIDFIHPEDKKSFEESVKNAIRTRIFNRIHYRFMNKKGEYIWLETIGKPIYSHDAFRGFIGSTRDITTQKNAQDALEKSETRYRTIFENTGTLTLIYDENMDITLINSEFEYFSGISKEILDENTNLIKFVAPEDRERFLGYHNIKKLNPNAVPKNYELNLINYKGESKSFITNTQPIPNTNKNLMSLIDITEQKKAEKLIQDSLHEKDMMLREIHHRVKNNLQVISSLLNLQSSTISDEKDLELFIESQNRIKSMALIHENLYQSEKMSHINFKDYLNYLANQLLMSYSLNTRVSLNMDCEDIYLGLETAVPCGLMANEIITNSMKHAFPNESKGNINIIFKEKENNYLLSISDDGIGLPDDLDLENSTSLGIQIIRSLINQIDGELKIKKDNGTEFIITFKELDYNERF